MSDKPTLKFMLVLQNLNTYIVTTPFQKPSDLQRWIAEIDSEFINDPIANLPPKSLADALLSPDEIAEQYVENDLAIPDFVISVSDRKIINQCHGTLFVDDNHSVFYSPKNKSEDWVLPNLIIRK